MSGAELPMLRVPGLRAGHSGTEVIPEDGSGEVRSPSADRLGKGIPEPISHQRQDLGRNAPVLKDPAANGMEVWYDRGIPGGAEWDAVIEERIGSCTFVLLFASPAAIGSRYVRREVKFADTLDTPILTVLLEDTVLGRGLEMLLLQYQMLDVRAADFPRRLRAAVDHLRGRASVLTSTDPTA